MPQAHGACSELAPWVLLRRVRISVHASVTRRPNCTNVGASTHPRKARGTLPTRTHGLRRPPLVIRSDPLGRPGRLAHARPPPPHNGAVPPPLARPSPSPPPRNGPLPPPA